MSSPIGPGNSPVSTASAASPSSIRKSLQEKPASSGSSKLPKENEVTINENGPDVEEPVSSPGSFVSCPGSRESDASTKLPVKAKARPFKTAPKASTATKNSPTAPRQKLMLPPKAPSSLPRSTAADAMDDSDSEVIESEGAAKKGNVEVSSSESASPTSSRSASPNPAASSSVPKDPASISATPAASSSRSKDSASNPKPQGTGAVKKRGRPKASSNAKPAKRIRSTPQSRAAPRASYNAASLVGEFTNFTTSIFIVQLGPESGTNCPKFHVHESVLTRSPILAHDIEVAKSAKTLTRKNILSLFPHDPVAFEQMLQFLYKDTFILKSNASSPLETRLKEFYELFSLGKHYVLPGLQKQVVKAVSQSRMVGKIRVDRFFDWGEDMYHEELDKEKGPFRGYFVRVAPGMVKKAKEGDVGAIAEIVGQGGGFASEIFKALYAALQQETRKVIVKKEETTVVLPAEPAAHKIEVDIDSSSPLTFG